MGSIPENSFSTMLAAVEETETIDSGAATEDMGWVEIGLLGGAGGVGPPNHRATWC